MRTKSSRKLGLGLLALAMGGIPLVTTATCDPRSGRFDFYRNDDDHYYDDDIIYIDDPFYYDDPYYYEECLLFVCW